MPLSMVKVGCTVLIKEISTDSNLASKLKLMGMFRGTPIKILSSEYGGPMILLVRGTQIALGYNIVSLIRVETIQ